MQFLLIAQDGSDALQKRLDVRQKHLDLGDRMKAQGKLLYAAATINETEEMNGSVMIFEMGSRQELNEYLETEPYVVKNVWENITIQECKVGPSFLE